MKFKARCVAVIVLLTLWQRANATSRIANRKQKKLIEGAMDPRAEPCEDFYKYACGNWKQVYGQAGSKYYEPISMLDYNANLEMSRAFNRFSRRNKPKFLQEAFNYYMSCKTLGKYEAINYLMWLKTNDNFKWPALWTQPKNNMYFDWVQMLAKMRTYGFNEVFVQQIVMSRINDAKTFIIDLDKPMSDGGFKPLVKENLKILMDSLPAQITNDNFEKLFKEINEFEQRLQELDTVEDVEVENENDYEMTRLIYLKDLPLEWLKTYVKIILNQTAPCEQQQLYIQNIPYMKALDELTRQYSQRFLCKYLEVRFLWYLHTNGPENFLNEECLANTRSLMPTAMHWQYEQLHPELLQEYSAIYQMFNNIRTHFSRSVLKNKHGFNATVIQFLQNKINNMELRLSNVPRENTIETLERFYQNLNLDANKFYENHLKLLRFNFLARRELLDNHQPVLDYTYYESGETGSSSSPYFVQNANTVFLPLTLLQYPIYTQGLDEVYRYSSLGFLLAHEMFHGFDDSGLLTAANGSMTLIQFEENPLFNDSFNCLYEINPLVIGEKIADISGLRYAYQAFFDSHPEAVNKTSFLHGNEVELSKLFFLNFAQFFCGDSSSEKFISMEEHGSDRDRLLDALSHFTEFSKFYKCKSHHRLYPHETCHLWR